MSDWVELGDRCWVRRYPEWDVNVGVVAGSDGVLVIDTRATLRQGEHLRADVRRLAAGPLRWVANTHLHFDHTFGNAAFVDDVGEQIYAHQNAAAAMCERGEWIKQQCRDDPGEDPEYPWYTAALLRDLIDTPMHPAPRTFTQEQRIDLGDRAVVLRHIGRGHTDGDAIALVPDVDTVFAGDLVEESGNPSYGNDCYPLDWPDTATALRDVLGEATSVVPGHGSPVDRRFVDRQRADLRAIATTIRDLHGAGILLDAALAHRDWPYPAESLTDAVRRGYAELG